jgi:hypothetical protein
MSISQVLLYMTVAEQHKLGGKGGVGGQTNNKSSMTISFQKGLIAAHSGRRITSTIIKWGHIITDTISDAGINWHIFSEKKFSDLPVHEKHGNVRV